MSTSSSHLTVTAPQINVGNDGDDDLHLQGKDVREKTCQRDNVSIVLPAKDKARTRNPRCEGNEEEEKVK